MISKQAINKYTQEKLEAYDWIKNVPEKELTQEINKYIPHYKFKIKPYKHQLASIIIGLHNTHFTYHLDMGTGKTAIILHLMKIRKLLGLVNKVLVLVPNVISIGSWGDEIEKHTDLTWVGLHGTKEERIEKLKKDCDIYILNYAGLFVLLTKKEIKIIKGENKEVRIPDIKKIHEFSQNFQMVVYDEIHSSGCGQRNTITFQIANQLSNRIKYRYGLTGTPTGRDPMMLWSQFYLIDRGESLGQTISFYRHVFFTIKINYWGGYEYKFKKSMEKILRKRLSSNSLRYSEEEANDLPDKIFNKIYLKFSDEAQQYYIRAVEGIREKLIIGNYKAIENAFVKLRQITAGFLGFKNEDGGRIIITFDDNPKLDAMEEILLKIPDEKVVIFNSYTKSGDLIVDRLKKLKIKFQRLYSGTKNKKETLQKFLYDSKYKVYLINSDSGSTVLNLQISRYCIFYELPIFFITWKQAVKRLHRSGSTKHVFYYDLIIKNSVDEKILEYIQEGKDVFKALIDREIVL